MAEEQNLNGLLGASSNAGMMSTTRTYGQTMNQTVWAPAKAAAKQVRDDWAAAEKSAKNMAMYSKQTSSFRVSGGPMGIITSALGVGTGTRIMNTATFSSSPFVSTGNTSNQSSVRFGPGGGTPPSGPRSSMGMPAPSFGAAAVVTGVAGLSALAAYGNAQQQNVYSRDLIAQQMAMETNRPASSFYKQYGNLRGSTSVSDMVQGQAAVMNMGFVAGTAQFNNYMGQLSTGAMQTGMGAAGFANVMNSLQSGKVGNSARAMLGVNIRNGDGSTQDYNKIALQVMKALHGGSVGTEKETVFSLRQGGNLDQALEALGLSPEAKTAIAASMKAQSIGGGGLSSLSPGRAATSKLDLVNQQEKLGAQGEKSAVNAMVVLNKTEQTAVGLLQKILNELHADLGAAGVIMGKLGHNAIADILFYKGATKLLGLLAGKKGVSTAVKVAEDLGKVGAGAGAAEAATGGALALGLGVAAAGVGVAAGAGYLMTKLPYDHAAAKKEQDYTKATGLINQHPGLGLGGMVSSPGAVSGSPYSHGSTMAQQVPGAAFTGSDGAMGGGASSSAPGGGMNAAVSIAMSYLNQPYVWGGAEPGGFDCSGLVKYVYAKLGVNLPHKASEQARMGKAVPNLAAALPGDLLFWGVPAHHVAIYIGNGKMIAAPHTGTVVQVQNVYGNPYVRRVLGNVNVMQGKNTNSLASGQGTSGGSGSVVGAMASSPLVSSSSTGATGAQMSAAQVVAMNLATAISGGGSGSSANGGTSSNGMGGSSMPNTPQVNSAPSSPSGNVALAQQMAGARGWTGNEWQALYAVWEQESGFKTNAGSPGRAYGIPQSLPGSKMASAGADWMTNPRTQIAWGLNYIAGRYKDPLGALKHKHDTDTNLGHTGGMDQPGGWYQDGAFEISKDQYARIHKGEMIIPAAQAKDVRNAVAKGGKGGGGVINIYVQTLDDATLRRAIEMMKRELDMDVVVQGLVND